MRLLSCLVCVLLVCGIWGCEPLSLSPVYTAETIAEDDRIAGEWVTGQSDDSKLVIKRGEGAKYQMHAVTLGDGGKEEPGRFEIVLTKIEDEMVWNISSDPHALEEVAERGGALLLPVHTFGRVTIEADTLAVRMLDPAWLHRTLLSNPGAIAYTRLRAGESIGPAPKGAEWSRKDSVLLTDSTENLRSFLEQHMATEEAWSDPVIYRRYIAERPKESP